MIQGYLIAGVAGLLLTGGAYLKGRTDGNEIAEARAAKAMAVAVADKLRIEEDWRKRERESENAARKKLEAVSARADDLASRLRNYWASIAVPESPGTPTGSPGTGPVGSNEGDIDSAVTRHLAACEQDAIWLNWWIERYHMTR